MFKKINSILLALALVFAAGTSSSFAACDPGERVVKLSHVTGGTTHPKVVAANNFAEQVNKQLNGKLCVKFIHIVHCLVIQKSLKRFF